LKSRIELLDCTLRDGAYIVDAKFGEVAIKGIIEKLQSAGVEIIECGWLKNSEHVKGTSFFHKPEDIASYINKKNDGTIYVAMIDWDRYDLGNLPLYDGSSIDAIRVVFPHGKHREGINVATAIREKGYKIYLQAANTLAYCDKDLVELARDVNLLHPEGLSVVDTFGAMYEEDLDRIITILNEHMDEDIKLGFHSHNNQQMAFANSMFFTKRISSSKRCMIVDSSLCGMGRGAGNTTTELMVNYLNSKHNHNYDLDAIMDAIDIYMTGFQEKYVWGYSTPYYIAGMYCCHVNNIAYLLNNHRTNAHDIRRIIESLSPEERKRYDYNLLEQKYIENQNRKVDDSSAISAICEELDISSGGCKILLVAPGKSSVQHFSEVQDFVDRENPLVIGVNAILDGYDYDYLFVTNSARYEYAQVAYPNQFKRTKKILLSNIKKEAEDNELIVNYNKAIKRGWVHFDNAVICALRLLDRLHIKDVYIAGFDGFSNVYNESYADESLPTLNPGNKWDELNDEIKNMFDDVKNTTGLNISFLTQSIFE